MYKFLRYWFEINYGHLGFSVAPYYYNEGL